MNDNSMFDQNIILEDDYVALSPMEQRHVDALHEAGKYSEIWRWTTSQYCYTHDSTSAWVSECIEKRMNKSQYPFVIYDKVSKAIVGSSSYLNISAKHKVIEIGYTFLTPSAQKSFVNRRCKFLLLSYAFDVLNVNRVAFQTSEKNTCSRKAILGLGAVFEGINRHCRVLENGDLRSSAVYSVISDEWDDVKQNLKSKLTRPTLGKDDVYHNQNVLKAH
ncbi:GNAT family N-acetyltransferase [Agaribacter marinus]|uniref:GCN5 family N-acetyltransferase n=1 Tax=Agaribacter marinus TaxID=1431249 RepID=A0AA37SXC4_9ALTE|nr:GNAT family protein [Agaribacter marinus]GLR69356.1 GCN5 family N-acetyltransferase [Agaribacter marinus]